MIHSTIAAAPHGAGATDEISAALGDTVTGRLVFSRGASHLRIDAAASPDELYRAHFDGRVPDIHIQDGTVKVRYRRFGLFDGRPRALAFNLNPTVPWELDLRGGVSGCTLDLRQLRLRSLEMRGGVSDVELDLAATDGLVPLRLAGGASNLTVRRPEGSVLTLRVRGGLSRMTMDGQEFAATDGEVSLESREQREGGVGYALDITGGASRLTLATR